MQATVALGTVNNSYKELSKGADGVRGERGGAGTMLQDELADVVFGVAGSVLLLWPSPPASSTQPPLQPPPPYAGATDPKCAVVTELPSFPGMHQRSDGAPQRLQKLSDSLKACTMCCNVD